ncbi:NERD domain-containing protein [Burkholderia sp. R-70199]|nr:NERD domain-containing protein [Burkholderia sp. R-70199]
MIIKVADGKETSIKTLHAILGIPGLSASKRAMVDQEIRTLKAGRRGEDDTAYEINFHMGNSARTAVLHDLRFELDDGRVAQIDHVLIHRTNRIWVLESKRVSRGVKITEDGEFLRWNGRQYDGMASPLEQNKRHVLVLKALIRTIKSAPAIEDYLSYVIVSSKARIDRPKKFDTSLVVKADRFLSAFEKDLDRVSLFSFLSAVFSEAEHVRLAKKLVELHKPIEFDYAARFGISPEAIVRVLYPAPPQAIQPIAKEVHSQRSAAPGSPVATVHPPATALPAVPPALAARPSAAETTSPPQEQEQSAATPGEWEYDPDWLDHLGLIGPTAAAKLPALADAEEQQPMRGSEEQSATLMRPAHPHEPVVASSTDAEHRCRNCDSTNIQVAHGRYGYYFKCRICAANTPIKISCGLSGHSERIRKDGAKFFRECAVCATSTLFFQNV